MDQQPRKKRTIPMKLLALGLCRTGTTSFKDALEKLGFQNVYGMNDVWEQEHMLFWAEITRRKRLGQLDGVDMREQFDHILGDFDAVSDIPAAIFAEELRAAYPEALVVLTTRSYESWHESMLKTVANPRNNTLFYRGTGWLNWKMGRFYKYVDEWSTIMYKDDFPRNSYRLFHEHNDMVRKDAPRDGHFLEFRASDGWGPLCKFLGKEIPNEPYPRSNTWEVFQNGDHEWTVALYKSRLKSASLVIMPFVAIGLWWMSKSRKI